MQHPRRSNVNQPLKFKVAEPIAIIADYFDLLQLCQDKFSEEPRQLAQIGLGSSTRIFDWQTQDILIA